mmetsp:Transcript_16701/g.38173  ORF Transcript_16701/g.38173 Transcript_16701/m.38173 type:complete len:245 (+) Transcript_16701:71-805(+)
MHECCKNSEKIERILLPSHKHSLRQDDFSFDDKCGCPKPYHTSHRSSTVRFQSPNLIDTGLRREVEILFGLFPVLFQFQHQKHGVRSVGLHALKPKLPENIGELVKGSLLALLSGISLVAFFAVAVLSFFGVTVLDSGSNLGNLYATVVFQNTVGLSNEICQVCPHQGQTKHAHIDRLVLQRHVRHVTSRHQRVGRNQIEGMHVEDVFVAFFALFVYPLYGDQVFCEFGIPTTEIRDDAGPRNC